MPEQEIWDKHIGFSRITTQVGTCVVACVVGCWSEPATGVHESARAPEVRDRLVLHCCVSNNGRKVRFSGELR